jgi:hypothetical protein
MNDKESVISGRNGAFLMVWLPYRAMKDSRERFTEVCKCFTRFRKSLIDFRKSLTDFRKRSTDFQKPQ